MSTSNPWDEFESGLPERDFEPAKSPDIPAPPRAQEDRPATPSAWDEVPSRTDSPSFDDLLSPLDAPEPVASPSVREPSPWDSSPTPVEEPAERVSETREPLYIPYEESRDGGSGAGRKIALIAVCSVAVVALAAGFVWGIPALLSGSEEPVAAATETPEPEETEVPQPPFSSLRSDPKDDLSFAVNLSSWNAESTYLSNVTNGFSKEGSGWSKADNEDRGYVGYSKGGCTVQWSQKDQSFDSGENDYSASIDALKEVTGSDDFSVEKYGYWTKDGGEKPVGKSEVVESRVDSESGSIVVAARAVIDIEQVGLIWSTCTDTDDLDAFMNDVRGEIGFILLDSRS